MTDAETVMATICQQSTAVTGVPPVAAMMHHGDSDSRDMDDDIDTGSASTNGF